MDSMIDDALTATRMTVLEGMRRRRMHDERLERLSSRYKVEAERRNFSEGVVA